MFQTVMAIRCLIVDAHPLFRQGLRRVLEADSGLEIAGEARDAAEAVEMSRQLRPNVVLMDISLPDSLEAARRITREAPGRRVIFLADSEDEEYLLQCSEAGASGYILKDAAAPHLLDAIRDVSAGRKYFSPQVLGRLVDDFRSRTASGASEGAKPHATRARGCQNARRRALRAPDCRHPGREHENHRSAQVQPDAETRHPQQSAIGNVRNSEENCEDAGGRLEIG